MKDKTYTVYMHINKINGKKYIGQTYQKLKDRWINGKGYKKQVFWNAIQKYGWDNFEHVILYEGLSSEEADEKEIEMIKYHKSNQKEFGYNISPGGSNGANDLWDNPDYKKAQAEKRKKIWENPEYRKKQIEFLNAYRNSEEYKLKRSKEFKLKWENGEFDEICCKKVICLETGIIYNSIVEASRQTGACRTDIGKCCNGQFKTANNYHWMYYNGENYSEEKLKEIIDNIGVSQRGIKITCVETGITYNSIKEAAKDVKVDNSGIGKVLKGKQKTAGGYHWIYTDLNN